MCVATMCVRGVRDLVTVLSEAEHDTENGTVYHMYVCVTTSVAHTRARVC